MLNERLIRYLEEMMVTAKVGVNHDYATAIKGLTSYPVEVTDPEELADITGIDDVLAAELAAVLRSGMKRSHVDPALPIT